MFDDFFLPNSSRISCISFPLVSGSSIPTNIAPVMQISENIQKMFADPNLSSKLLKLFVTTNARSQLVHAASALDIPCINRN